MSRALLPTDLVDQSQTGDAEKTPTIRNLDTRPSSVAGTVARTRINFGKPSQSSLRSSSTSGSEWANLLKQTASGGIASAFTEGLGGIGGVGSLISGFLNLFGGGGGQKTLPPLVEFQLPSAQEQTLYVSSKGSSVYQGNVMQPNVSSDVRSTYSNTGQIQTSGSSPNSEWIQQQSGQIAQAVKNALLNSSSLNDVIAEI